MLLTLTGVCLKPWKKCRRSVSCQVGASLFRLSLCLSAGEKEEESLAESLMVLEAVSISCRTIQNCRTLVVAGDAKGERRIWHRRGNLEPRWFVSLNARDCEKCQWQH